MKILHFITSLRKSAGTTTFVNGLCETLHTLGHEVVIALTRIDGEYLGEAPQVPLRIVRITDVVRSEERFDIVHIHGLWQIPLITAARWAVSNGMPIVWSPHGALAPWAMRHRWWKKLIIWYFAQKPVLRKAALFHSTAEQESVWIRDAGFSQNIVEVPLGTTIGSDCYKIVRKPAKRCLLFVGRIYPVKGLVNLIKAWRLVCGSGFPDGGNWVLRIVGPDQAGHRAELEELAQGLRITSSVEFPGAKFGDELVAEYEGCDCLVLPSFTENFGGVVVDALAHGKPCIASTFTPWRELQEHGCGWWVSNEPTVLANAIRGMMNAGEAFRCEMGKRGRKLVEEKYTWCAVTKKMIEGYKSAVRK